eukprot:scaffold118871_cov60-Phaeocystis_antarctica.AAC.2
MTPVSRFFRLPQRLVIRPDRFSPRFRPLNRLARFAHRPANRPKRPASKLSMPGSRFCRFPERLVMRLARFPHRPVSKLITRVIKLAISFATLSPRPVTELITRLGSTSFLGAALMELAPSRVRRAPAAAIAADPSDFGGAPLFHFVTRFGFVPFSRSNPARKRIAGSWAIRRSCWTEETASRAALAFRVVSTFMLPVDNPQTTGTRRESSVQRIVPMAASSPKLSADVCAEVRRPN